MDFLSNLIKRPHSIAVMSTANGGSSSAPSSSESPSENASEVAPALERCAIDTDLENLLNSASRDLDSLEEQHNLLIDAVEPEEKSGSLDTPTTPRETIQQLLCDINVNLDQVTANEMEHLQAMSLELNPLAVKTTPRSSMEQQKALVAAMRSTSQPGTPTLTSCDPLKFTGLPEFDETQIPELAPLTTEMEAQLKADSSALAQGYHSDSDVYAECLSLDSGKLSAEHSDIEAYSSALNEVLEQQLTNVTVTTLENTLSEADAALGPAANLDNSCEPMDVDEISETMEMLKDVLAPEDHQMLQQQFLSATADTAKEQPDNEKSTAVAQPAPVIAESLPLPRVEPIAAQITSPPIPTHRPKTAEELKELMMLQQFDLPKEELKQDEQLATPVKQEEQATPIKQGEDKSVEMSIKQEEQQCFKFEQIDPRTEKEEEKDIQIEEEYAATQQKTEVQPESNLDNLPLKEEAHLEAAPSALVSSVAHAEPVTPGQTALPPLELHLSESTPTHVSAPTSPSFPIKPPAEAPAHFPRSPHAPPEHEEMAYLEEAVIEPSADRKLSLSGVIAREPLPIQLTVTEPSPEKPEEKQPLDETIPLSHGSPLNGTFEHQEPAAFGVPLEAAGGHQQRRTFSLNTTADAEQQSTLPLEELEQHDDTFAMPLNAVKDTQRRTFSLAEVPEQSEATNKRQTFHIEESQMRRTFCMQQDASPAMEATEENIVSDEPMDSQTQLRETYSPPIPTHQSQTQLRETHSPPIPTHQNLKRPSIHADRLCPNATVVLEEQTLSAKEQLSASDEKEDVFVEHFGAMSPISDDIFKSPQFTSSAFSNLAKEKAIEAAATAVVAASAAEEHFQDGTTVVLNSSDFDYLYTKGISNAPIDRSSLLLKFDPLLGTPVPVNLQSQQEQEQKLLNVLSSINSNNNSNNNNPGRALSPTLEEHETSGSNQSFVIEPSAKAASVPTGAGGDVEKDPKFKPPVDRTKKHAKMSVDVIDNDCNKTFDNSNLNSEDKTHKFNNMDELEKKIKNEVTRSEDIEKKLKEAEQREEALVKRITEKDKANSKLNGVIEAYEKAIAELIHDKEQLVQNHEREMLEVQADRDSNYHHLTSLETTFSDLHVKYEKSKEMTSQLKQVEENLLEEKKKLMDKLRQQEQRYEQMRSHAMQQMEIANKKMATLTKDHTDEVKKLKALLKKEEVSRISTAEQLQQKSRENADLLKICEELIYDKGQGGSS
ncbi:hypothetical protein KR222_007815 [Zaprionus bogoriensis]|nr:hypothetical protein KR222_007815 [Zaprionus bogoriensis]